MNPILEGYKPASFFRWFDEISAIPRGSGTEEGIRNYLIGFALKRGYYYEIDEPGNLFVRVPSTPGYENEPPLLIQAHMDMVWAKAPGSAHDFTRDSIEYRIENGFLYGKDTNLGSDNGIGIAFMLAVCDGDEFSHPELELLFTVKEEVGLVGIKNFDMSKLKSRRMINTDCGYSHGMCVSSVGKRAYDIQETMLTSVFEEADTLEVRFLNGLGGHSGLDSHRNRADAAGILGELLCPLLSEDGLRLSSVSMTGGPIHPVGSAIVAVSRGKGKSVANKLTERFAVIKKDRYALNDPSIELEVSVLPGSVACVSPEDSKRVLYFMNLIYTGALRHDANDLSYIISSSSLLRIALENGAFAASWSVRSAIDGERDALAQRYLKVSELLGFASKETLSSYGGWPERSDSKLQALVREKHEELFHRPIEIEHIHGGIEVSFVVMAHPDMDVIGISPTCKGAHTLDEHLFLDEVEDFWNLMKAVLAAKSH